MSASSRGDAGVFGVGIVGCGHILPTHTKAWAGVPGCEIRGLYDIDADLAARRAAALPGAVAFGSLDELLARCDIVDVCSPPGSHREVALRSLDAGRDLLIEKPVTPTVAEWDDVRARAESTGRTVCAVHQHKLAPHVVRAKEWIDRGRIGEVLRVSCDFFVHPENDPMLAVEGHWSHRLAGGRWLEVLPHLLYLVHMFTGRLEVTDVTVSHADGAPPGAPADNVVATLRGERCLATLHLSARSRLDRRRLIITGTDGVIEICILRGVSWYTDLRHIRRVRGVGLVGLPFIEAASTLAQMVPDRVRHVAARVGPSQHCLLMRAFVRHLRGQGPAPTPLDEIDSVVRCCEAIGEGIDDGLVARGITPLSRVA